jgi:hypothetical protein
MAIALCAYELATATLWAALRDGCVADECPRMIGILSGLAGVDVPVLTVVLFLIAGGYSVRVARSW